MFIKTMLQRGRIGKRTGKFLGTALCVLFFTALLCLPAAAQTPDSGQAGSVYWSLGSDGVLTIQGKAAIPDYANAYSAPWFSRGHKAEIQNIHIHSGVTGIGNNAFAGCPNLTALTVPGTVTAIGDSAFANCPNLIDVLMEEGVRTLGNWAFNKCAALEALNLPQSLRTMGQSVFAGCSALQAIVIPPAVAELKAYAFRDCAALESAALPEGLSGIGQQAFSGCYALKTVNIPKRTATLGAGVFRDCESLREITVPAAVTELPNLFFAGSGLRTVTLPNGLTKIGDSAFADCVFLRDVYYTGSEARWASVTMTDFRQQISSQGIRIHFGEAGAARPPVTVDSVRQEGIRIVVEIGGEPGELDTLFAAFYDKDGRLMGVRAQAAETAGRYYVPEVTGAALVKVFILDETARPMAEAVEQALTDS